MFCGRKNLEYLECNCDKDSGVTENPNAIINTVTKQLIEFDDNKKIEFIIEQLRLVFTVPKGRRFSSSMLAMAVMW